MKARVLLVMILAAGAAGARATGSDAVAPLVEAQTAFACDLYRTLDDSPGNLLLSPFSVAVAMTMTSAGASGRTAQEMAAALHLDGLGDEAHPLCGILQHGSNRTTPGAGIVLANRLWPARGLGLQPRFLARVARDYGARPQPVDFARDPACARRTINAWIGEQTAGAIPELLQPADINSSTLLVLTNAIRFQGRWARRFDPGRTAEGEFHVAADRSVPVPFMTATGRFLLAELPDLQVLQLNYDGDEYAFVLALPRPGRDLAAIERNLSPPSLAGWFDALEPGELTVSVPRFELENRLDLKSALIRLGMESAFGGDADFSAMLTGGSVPLDEVVHQAKLIIDEEGTEAAAATAVTMKRGFSMLRADRPFLFLVRDLRTGTVLFLGRFVEPGA